MHLVAQVGVLEVPLVARVPCMFYTPFPVLVPPARVFQRSKPQREKRRGVEDVLKVVAGPHTSTW